MHAKKIKVPRNKKESLSLIFDKSDLEIKKRRQPRSRKLKKIGTSEKSKKPDRKFKKRLRES